MVSPPGRPPPLTRRTYSRACSLVTVSSAIGDLGLAFDHGQPALLRRAIDARQRVHGGDHGEELDHHLEQAERPTQERGRSPALAATITTAMVSTTRIPLAISRGTGGPGSRTGRRGPADWCRARACLPRAG